MSSLQTAAFCTYYCSASSVALVDQYPFVAWSSDNKMCVQEKRMIADTHYDITNKIAKVINFTSKASEYPLLAIAHVQGPDKMDEKDLCDEHYWENINNGKFQIGLDFDYDEWMEDEENYKTKFITELAQIFRTDSNNIILDNYDADNIRFTIYIHGIWRFYRTTPGEDMYDYMHDMMVQDQICVKYKGLWYDATVCKSEDKRFQVRFNPLDDNNGADPFLINTEWFDSKKGTDRLRFPGQFYNIHDSEGHEVSIQWKPPNLASRDTVYDIQVNDHIFVNFDEKDWRRCIVYKKNFKKNRGFYIDIKELVDGKTKRLKLWDIKDRNKISFMDMKAMTIFNLRQPQKISSICDGWIIDGAIIVNHSENTEVSQIMSKTSEGLPHFGIILEADFTVCKEPYIIKRYKYLLIHALRVSHSHNYWIGKKEGKLDVVLTNNWTYLERRVSEVIAYAQGSIKIAIYKTTGFDIICKMSAINRMEQTVNVIRNILYCEFISWEQLKTDGIDGKTNCFLASSSIYANIADIDMKIHINELLQTQKYRYPLIAEQVSRCDFNHLFNNQSQSVITKEANVVEEDNKIEEEEEMKETKIDIVSEQEMKELQETYKEFDELNKIGDSIDPPTVHSWNNYDQNEQSFDFDDGWEFTIEQQLSERRKRLHLSRGSPSNIQHRNVNDIESNEESKQNIDYERIIISNALVVNICIDEYDGDKKNKYKAANLNGTKLDRQHMIDVFVDKYNYDMLSNKNKRCSRSDFDNIIRIAQTQFGDEQNGYQCIIFIFSGHGLENNLICSNIESEHEVFNEVRYEYAQKNRSKVRKAFNGDYLPNKITSYKFFFMDACRGYDNANPIEIKANNDNESKNIFPSSKSYHPDANTGVFYPNTSGYSTYSEPGKGGILLSALYDALMNDNKDNDKSITDIENIMSSKTDNRNIDVLYDKGKILQHPVLIETSYTGLPPKERANIYFEPNCIPKSQRPFNMNNPNNYYRNSNVEFK